MKPNVRSIPGRTASRTDRWGRWSAPEPAIYPALEPILDEALLLREAEVEHDSARQLIAKIEAGKPGDALFDATVIVLCEYVEHHVKEEEREMFPEVRGSKKVDLVELGERMAARKEALLQTPMKTPAKNGKESSK